MATIDDQRHQMIRRAVGEQPEALVDITIILWNKLASQLVSIIGQGGFQSLYSRSVNLTGAKFPWMAESASSRIAEDGFAGLRRSLEGRAFSESRDASILLLSNLVNVLTMLIGDVLTTGILRAAWGDNNLDSLGKE
ncbi:MAG: hypothetical protein H7315_05805 [Herminiimonas sp.]|nr:hypothetical protein [Herminiimonas sp.]